jgi:hypothetical protein
MSRGGSPPALPPPKPRKPVVAATPTPVAEPPAPPTLLLRVQSFAPARIVDVDGDQRDELLLPFERSGGSVQNSEHFGVFDMSSGKLLNETPALDDNSDAVLTAVVAGRLIRARPSGKLSSYDLASGHEQWSSVLGERVAALCEPTPAVADTLHVVTDDGRNMRLDVKTGRQTETRHTCQVPLAVSTGRQAPNDRRDYRAPLGMAAFRCGGVRVMGSRNYAVPDACQTQLEVDSDHLPNMVGHAIWRTARGLLVLGVRKPGAYVPSVGLLEGRRWLWKQEVPAQDPLAAEPGGPRIVSLHADRLLLGYRVQKPQQDWVTCFDLRDGTRSWSRQLPDNQGLVALVQNAAVVVVHAAQGVLLLDAPTGAPVATIGSVH